MGAATLGRRPYSRRGMTNLDYGSGPTGRPSQIKSTASMIAIVASIGSFVLSGMGREILAILAAGVGILCGLLGFVRAASPRVSGGILSLVAIVLSVIAVLVALIALIV